MTCYFTRSNLKSKKSQKRQKLLALPPERLGAPCGLCGEDSAYCTAKRKDGRTICENCYRKNSVESQATRKKWIWEHKEAYGCTLCEEGDPKCLDYHHMNPEKKKFSIGSVSSSVPNKAIQIEIAKCIILCANCHRKVEAAK